MKNKTRFLISLVCIYVVVVLFLAVKACNAAPRTMIDLTQFDMEQVKNLQYLKADVCMATVSLTPELRGAVLKDVIKKLGCYLVMTTDGGVNPMHLLEEPNWSGQPRQIGGSGKILFDAGVPLHFLMLYTEFNRQHENSTLLINDDLKLAYQITQGKHKIIPLIRSFEPPGKSLLTETMKLSAQRYPGVFIEIAASVDYARQVKTCEMMQFVVKNDRLPVIMISGQNPSINYAGDVKLTCAYLKKTCPEAFTDRAIFGVAFYEREKGIKWRGGRNSVTAALGELKECLK